MTENKSNMCDVVKTVVSILGSLSPEYADKLIEHAELLRKVQDKKNAKTVLVEKETLRDAIKAINSFGYNFKNLETAIFFLSDFFNQSADNEDAKAYILNSFEETEKVYRIAKDYILILQVAMRKVCELFTNIVADVELDLKEETAQKDTEPLAEQELTE